MGFSCAYYIFVATNLRYLTLLASGCKWDFPFWFFIAVQVLIYVPLSWVRKIKSFSITSLIADVFILFGLIYILSFDIFKISAHGIAKDLLWINYESFPLLIGTAMFAFEGICLILPIAQSMKKPEQFTSVITWCVFTIGTVFIIIGSMGYMALGNDVSTVIFLDLPQGPFPNGLQFFYVVAIILSFPLCVYPAIRITEVGIFGIRDGKSSHWVKWQKNLFRTVVVSSLGLISWAGSDSLDKVVSLVGCFACIPLSFIYPAMFHFKITTSQFYKTIDLLLIVFGTIAMLYTTYVTVQQWAMNAPSPQKDPCSRF
jgi:proton-coupled amino acid transporter